MDKFVSDFLTFFTTIDPIGTLTIFVGLTAHATPEERVKIAWRCVMYAALILVLFIVIGQILLGSIGIQISSFQLAGGIVFFLFGLQMVFGTGSSTPDLDKEEGHDVAVFPLAVPSLASPGAILAAVVSTDNREFSIGEQAITACLLLVVLGICLVTLLQANRIYRILGNAGSSLIVRVMGLVLCGLAVEMILEAIYELIPPGIAG